MESHQTYRRNQIEWALWRQLIEGNSGALPEPPAAFKTRVKKFLDMDREPELNVHGKPAFAFGDGSKAGKGTERRFTHFDATCLAIAMDMMESGLKQSEIVHALKHSRPAIRHFYDKFMNGPDPVSRTARHPKDYPGKPTYTGDSGIKKVDWRVYIVLRRNEFTGRFAERFRKDQPEILPHFLAPDFCIGVDDLRDFFNDHCWQFRKAYVGEIARPARRLAVLLEKAPEVRRGRP